jgi:hypothetical protein
MISQSLLGGLCLLCLGVSSLTKQYFFFFAGKAVLEFELRASRSLVSSALPLLATPPAPRQYFMRGCNCLFGSSALVKLPFCEEEFSKAGICGEGTGREQTYCFCPHQNQHLLR